jgi:hypothetical protein
MPHKERFGNNLDNFFNTVSVMTFIKDITMQNLYHLKTFYAKSILIRVMLHHFIILLSLQNKKMKIRKVIMERVLQLTLVLHLIMVKMPFKLWVDMDNPRQNIFFENNGMSLKHKEIIIIKTLQEDQLLKIYD